MSPDHLGDDDFTGDVAGLTIAAGGFVAEAFGTAAGLDAGGFAPVTGLAPCRAAGRKPRLLGLFSKSAARLLTIFASFIATSISAAVRMSLRWLVNSTVICCRTFGLSSVRFPVRNCFSCSLKMYQRPPGELGDV